jgi:hypothetical protein
MYYENKGRIFNSLNITLRESLGVKFVMILIILFCIIKTLTLYLEYTQEKGKIPLKRSLWR